MLCITALNKEEAVEKVEKMRILKMSENWNPQDEI